MLEHRYHLSPLPKVVSGHVELHAAGTQYDKSMKRFKLLSFWDGVCVSSQWGAFCSSYHTKDLSTESTQTWQ